MDKRTDNGKKVLEDFFLPKSKAQEPKIDEPEVEVFVDPDDLDKLPEKPAEKMPPSDDPEEQREKEEHPDPDWMHSLPGYQNEVAIHEELAREYEERQKKSKEVQDMSFFLDPDWIRKLPGHADSVKVHNHLSEVYSREAEENERDISP